MAPAAERKYLPDVPRDSATPIRVPVAMCSGLADSDLTGPFAPFSECRWRQTSRPVPAYPIAPELEAQGTRTGFAGSRGTLAGFNFSEERKL